MIYRHFVVKNSPDKSKKILPTYLGKIKASWIGYEQFIIHYDFGLEGQKGWDWEKEK